MNKNKKYGLALHTTTRELGLCLSNFGGDYRCKILNLGMDVASSLHQELVEFIRQQKWSDLAWIAVAKGPGGFTGTRIGVVTARTLAQQLNIPVFAISSLAALAWQEKNKVNNKTPIAVEMKAHREQIFTAIYQIENDNLKTLLPDSTMNYELWEKTLSQFPDYHRIEAPENLGFTVESVLHLAFGLASQNKYTNWQEVLPFYGQQPVLKEGG